MPSRILTAFYHDTVLGFSVGLLLGAWTQANWQLMAKVATAGVIWRVAALSWTEWRRHQNARAKAKEFTELRAPDPEAVRFADKHGHGEVVVGKVIEIWAHPSLDSLSSLYDLGADPNVVNFSAPAPREFSESLVRCGGLKSFPPPNQRKYGIARLPLGTMDDENFTVEFFETDWNTWMSVRTKIEHNANLRQELSDIVPGRSRIPQSMSLQFLVRFTNGDILAMKRKEGVASEPDAWSISGEEQLHEQDFRSESVTVAEYLFRRAFVEEVFGNRGADQSHLNRIWIEDCIPIVRSHRIWSFFLEENVGIFQTFGVYQLNIRPHQLQELHKNAVSAGWGTTDPEGFWYVVRESDIPKLLKNGSCDAYRLHGIPERVTIEEPGLHATSRYRLWRLHTALSRKRAETLASLNLGVPANVAR
jgi:hypothetical protein